MNIKITNLTNEQQYGVAIYTQNQYKQVNTTVEAPKALVTPQAYKVYGVRIDTTNSNPETSVVYTDDAVGFTPAGNNTTKFSNGSWLDKFPFNQIRPCLFKNGAVVGYLNPSDFSKFEDGSSADITSGNAGDVMIEIPKTGYMIYKEGNYIYVKITDNPDAKSIDNRFCFYGHTRVTDGDRDKLYIGAYLGYNSSNTLKSISGKLPYTNTTMTNFRTYAQANGSGYDLLSFYPLTLIQCLYLIRYKNLNSQTALGFGRIYSSASKTTGTTNSNGMYYGSDSDSIPVKIFGIEDLWAHTGVWIEGVSINTSNNVVTAFRNFNNNLTGYTIQGNISTANPYHGLIKSVSGTSGTGFLGSSFTGSTTTYWCDYGHTYPNGGAYQHGGYWGLSGTTYESVGIFEMSNLYGAGSNQTMLGGRLMYL